MTTPQIVKATPEADEIDLGKLFGTLIDGRWFIIAMTFIFATVGVVFALLSTPIFKADALIQVEQKAGGVSSLISDGLGDMFAQDSSATTEIELIKSRMVLGQTVDKLNLTTVVQPIYLPIVGKGLARLQGKQGYIDVARLELPNSLSERQYSKLELHQRDDVNSSFEILSNDEVILSGKVGELLTTDDGFAIFVTQLNGIRNQAYSLSKISRIDAINRLQSALSISERGKQTGILQLSLEGEYRHEIERILNDISQNYFLQNVARQSVEAEKSLTFLREHLPGVKESLTIAEDILNQYRQDHESVDLGLEAQSALKVMVELEAKLNDLTFKESEISQRYTSDHPAYRSLLEKRETLLGERERLNRQIQQLPKTQREVLRMTRDVEVNQQIYVQLLNKVQELNIMKAGTVGNVRIVDSAQSYSHAVKPKKPLIVVLATLLGGMMSIAFVLIKSAFYRGLETAEQIEALGLSVYASVPKSEHQALLSMRARKKKAPEELLATSNPVDISIEALRGLRTSLHFAMMEAKNNVVMISGPAPGVGKSFISNNFSSVVAQIGQKVLLVDADMRKGHLHRTFKVVAENGLSDLLSGKQSTKDVVQPTHIEGLHLITRGSLPPNPSELLMHARFNQFIEWASKEYDLVIIDTPPVLAVTDPCIVGAIAGTTMMVARYEQNTSKELEAAQMRFERAGIEVKGVIFNAMERKASNDYGYGYYSYAYGIEDK